jgi:hypothetical protein
MYEAFIDLDELVLLCRDKSSRKLIQEAVSCYRTGAFHSCIVATWNAVVFDFLHKLREMEFLGDKEAEKLLKEFEKLRISNQFKELWKFESDIPKNALEKFELISTVEKSDIERLFEDRSRCAHPSMISLEEPFEAPAELARYHLRSAVTHLLARPPVQGRAARERIFQIIRSELFPIDPEEAIKHLENSPLVRARRTLIRDVVIGLTKSLLVEDYPEDERQRQLSALQAISKMYYQETSEFLNEKLSEIIQRVTDENWERVIIYLGTIQSWDSLDVSCRLKAESYIEKIEILEAGQGIPTNMSTKMSERSILLLIKAFHINFVDRSKIIDKFRIPPGYLLSSAAVIKDEDFKKEIIAPILEESFLQFDLGQLITISKNFLEPLSRKHRDRWLADLIESRLKDKISAANLNDLLAAKSAYKNPLSDYILRPSADSENPEIIELFNSCIAKRLGTIPFNDLIQMNWRQIPENLMTPLLKNNIDVIIEDFANSRSYEAAGNYADLLTRIAEHLSPEQWGNILSNFFKNDQIYRSWPCVNAFELLYGESLACDDSVQYHWQNFRRNLNSDSGRNFANLKQMIDSQIGNSYLS